MGPIALILEWGTVAWAAGEVVDIAEVAVPLWLTVGVGLVTLVVGVLGIRGQLLRAFDKRASEMADRIVRDVETRVRVLEEKMANGILAAVAQNHSQVAALTAQVAELRGQDQLAHLLAEIIATVQAATRVE